MSRKKNRTPLNKHKRTKKKLLPPLRTIPSVHPTSWMNDRLPNYLYSALLITHLPREEALGKFREIVRAFAESKDPSKPADLSHTTLTKCDQDYLYQILSSLFNTEKLKSVLRPLLLFDKLPAYSVWERVINSKPSESDWELLKKSIGKTLYHQSQEATDIQWLEVLYALACGKLHFNSKMKERVEEIWYYPDKGDMRQVRPVIRATGSILSGVFNDESKEWIDSFWKTCLFNTAAVVLLKDTKPAYSTNEKLKEKVLKSWKKLTKAFYDTLENSSINPKHDASFGLVMYSYRLLIEALNHHTGSTITGRLVLRTIVESYITLSYLVKKDDTKLWKSYRSFGSGQAKLVSLKADNFSKMPSFFDLEEINKIANEDVWEEFVNIQLGNWNGTNLRQMSLESETKEVYDKYYDWASSYVHCNWSAVRDSIFTTDFNPLHRLMRVPVPKENFNDVIKDVVEIVNLQLKQLTKLYGIDIKELKL